MTNSDDSQKIELTSSNEAIDNVSGFWVNRLITWWSRFSLRTKLLAIATLVVSLLMTGITFFALNLSLIHI